MERITGRIMASKCKKSTPARLDGINPDAVGALGARSRDTAGESSTIKNAWFLFYVPFSDHRCSFYSTSSQSFVFESVLVLAKTYPVAAGLKAVFSGNGNGGLRQLLTKNTGCVVAGLYVD
jgi:hypothetical protein